MAPNYYPMPDPSLNEEDHEWYSKSNHVKIPKKAESKHWLDPDFAGGTPTEPDDPLLISATLTGTPYVGNQLGVTVEQLGAGALTYQWRRSGVDISGATLPTYVLLVADHSASITVRVTKAGVVSPVISNGLVVTYSPPVASGNPSDLTFVQGTGDQTVATAPFFTGSALFFTGTKGDGSALPAGVTVNSSTGVCSIDDANVIALTQIKVQAANSGGNTFVLFSITVTAAPTLTSAALTGTAKIGNTLGVTVTHSGAGALSYQWRRGASDISGATGATYLLVTADDTLSITVRVTKAGVGSPVISNALVATELAPDATGNPSSISFMQGTGDQTVATATFFIGNTLVFTGTKGDNTALPAGVTVNSSTGVVTVDDAGVIALTQIKVTATNSGGFDFVLFNIEVTAIPSTYAWLWEDGDIMLWEDGDTLVQEV